MTTRRRDNHTVALDLRRSQQADHVSRHDTTIVNRLPYDPKPTLNMDHPKGMTAWLRRPHIRIGANSR